MQIIEDKRDFNIDLTEDAIINMKKENLEKNIKKKLRIKANEYLFKLRKNIQKLKS